MNEGEPAMHISEQAIEAAAKAAHVSKLTGVRWDDIPKWKRVDRLSEARAALEAATPHLMAAAVDQARANNDHINPDAGAYSSGFHYALDCVYVADDPAGDGE